MGDEENPSALKCEQQKGGGSRELWVMRKTPLEGAVGRGVVGDTQSVV